jgi:hypothetical protein
MELGELSQTIVKSWSVFWPKVRKLEEHTDEGRALCTEEEAALIGATVESPSRCSSGSMKIALMTGMRSGEITAISWIALLTPNSVSTK